MSERDLRLLCLDGGGVRGLASLYLLKQILSYVGNPKPCEFFDMMCGTSTGGLIAIMLGRLEMSIDQCIDAFTEMMGLIFDQKKKDKLAFKWYNGRVNERYDAKILEDAIKKVIESAGFPSDALMRGPKKSTCKVFVVAQAEEGKTVARFTSYPKPGEHTALYDETKIWQAARATSAATSFFAPIDITAGGTTRRFLDAALGHNNPVNELWMEAAGQFCAPGASLEPRIRVLVSIGTGKPPMSAFGKSVRKVAQSIIDIANETEDTARTFHKTRPELANRDGYFRFNPPDISEVGLDEADKRAIIAQRCEAYGDDPDTERVVARWAAAAGDEQKPCRISKAPPRIKSKLFYTLGRGTRYIRPDVRSYWHHLTLESYHVYENIYHDCKSSDGKVEFDSFLQQFNPSSNPSLTTIKETWTRLLRSKSNVRSSILPKPLAMAVFYMLHIESCLDVAKPQLANGRVGVDGDRREALKRFAKWVPCQCHQPCGREWNFVNDIGLSRGGGIGRKCAVARLFERPSWQNFLAAKEMGWLEETRGLWIQGATSS